MINVFQPTVGTEELAAVAEVFRSNWIGKGGRTTEFEAAFAGHLGVGPDRVMSVNSGTEALFIAMELVGAGPGDEVVLPTVSFVGAGNAIAARGARPVFCDVDPRTLNPTVDDVEAVLTPRTKAVVILHYGGAPGDVTDIAALCGRRGVQLVEDAACSIASRVDGEACGVIGDIGVWSLGSSKIVVTADGGLLTAKDPEVVQRAVKLAYLGLQQSSGFAQAARSASRWWDFDVSSFSRRSVLNDMQAAVGLVQLRRLGSFITRRAEVVAAYDRTLSDLPEVLLPPPLPAGHESSHYLYWVQLDERIRDDVARDLYAADIYTTFRYPALHLIPMYGSDATLPGAEAAVRRTLCLPVHQGLSDDDVATVVREFRRSVARRSAALPPVARLLRAV
jgi:dTDP-4-amino-4,6-dideoxygalactose transaminase